jgi:hypothetical protein
MTHDHCLGPYGLNDTLPNCDSNIGTVYDVALRALADSPLPNDPEIAVESGANRFDYLAEFVGISEQDFERAALVTKIVERLRARRVELMKEIERLQASLAKNEAILPPPKVKAPASEPYVEPDRYVAVHEAGHAVMARLLSCPVFKAAVRSDNSGIVHRTEPPADLPAESEDSSLAPSFWCRDSMIVTLGGAAAQLIDNPAQFSRSVPAGAFAGDAETFFEAAYLHLTLDGAPAAVWREAAKDSGRGITKAAKAARDGWLKNPATVPLEVRQLYNELFSAAEKLLRDNWPAVLRVAEALLESGELNQAQIDELIGPEKLAEQPTTDETSPATSPSLGVATETARSVFSLKTTRSQML